MNRITLVASVLILAANFAFSQTLDKSILEVSQEDLSGKHKFGKELNCQSIQSQLFYDDPSLYEFMIGKVTNKRFQTIELKGKSGSVMYFDFDKDPEDAEGFLSGLLWGGDGKPTSMHPEEILSSGNTLIITSFPYSSALGLEILGILKAKIESSSE